jgi:hypothetical protein
VSIVAASHSYSCSPDQTRSARPSNRQRSSCFRSKTSSLVSRLSASCGLHTLQLILKCLLRARLRGERKELEASRLAKAFCYREPDGSRADRLGCDVDAFGADGDAGGEGDPTATDLGLDRVCTAQRKTAQQMLMLESRERLDPEDSKTETAKIQRP